MQVIIFPFSALSFWDAVNKTQNKLCEEKRCTTDHADLFCSIDCHEENMRKSFWNIHILYAYNIYTEEQETHITKYL